MIGRHFISIFILFTILGNEVIAKSNFPKRIISLGPLVTKQLYLLGVEDRLIANTIYCTTPPEAKNKEKIGSVIRADLEKIISLKPDLVIATSLSNLEQLEKLKDLGIKVLKIPAARSFCQLCQHFIKIGEAVGKKREAKKIIKEVKKEVANIYKNTKRLPKPKVIVQIGAEPLYVAPKDSFINDFIKFAGGINIGPRGKNGLYSREKVLYDNPEVIIIVTMGIVAEKEKEVWQHYKTIDAVKNGRIYIIEADKICSPTPISFVETLKELVKILQTR
jgi:iron complex transport system substrate-binding protein